MTRPGIEPATSGSQSGRSTTEPLCLYEIWWKSTEIYSSYCPESKIRMCCRLINLSKIDEILPLVISKQMSTTSMHTPSLVKIHWHLIKLLSRNENTDMSRADNCQNLMKFAYQQSQSSSPQYQCTHQVWWKSTDIYWSNHPEMKICTCRRQITLT